MGKTRRKKYTSEFKAKVVLEALKERSSLTELSEKYEVSSVMISRWKNQVQHLETEQPELNQRGRRKRTGFTARLESWRWNWILQSGYQRSWGL